MGSVKKLVAKKREKRQLAIVEAANNEDLKALLKYKPEDVAKALIQVTKDSMALLLQKMELEEQLKVKYPGGRKPKYSDDFRARVRRFYKAGGQTYASTAAHFEISKSTVGRILNNRKK